MTTTQTEQEWLTLEELRTKLKARNRERAVKISTHLKQQQEQYYV